MKVFDDGLVNDDEKVAQFLLQSIPNSRLELKILTLLETKMITIDTLYFWPKRLKFQEISDPVKIAYFISNLASKIPASEKSHSSFFTFQNS